MKFVIPITMFLTVAAASCDVFRLRVANSTYQGLFSGQYLSNQTTDANVTMSTKYTTAIMAAFAPNSTEIRISNYDRLCIMPNGRVGFKCATSGQGNSTVQGNSTMQGTTTGWKLRKHELGNIVVHGDAMDEGWLSAPRYTNGTSEVAWEVYWGKRNVSGPGTPCYGFKVVQECI